MADSQDWRTQLGAHSRQRVIIKIRDTLAKNISRPIPLEQLQKVAGMFEAKVFAEATSASDYLNKLRSNVVSVDKKPQQNGLANSLPPNPAVTITNQNHMDPASQSMQYQFRNQGNPHVSLANHSKEWPQHLSLQIQHGDVENSSSLQCGLASGTARSPSIMPIGQSSTPQNISGLSQNLMGLGLLSNASSQAGEQSSQFTAQSIVKQNQLPYVQESTSSMLQQYPELLTKSSLLGQHPNTTNIHQHKKRQNQLDGQQDSATNVQLNHQQQQQQQQRLLGQQTVLSNMQRHLVGPQNISNLAEVGRQQQQIAQTPSASMKIRGEKSLSEPLQQQMIPQLHPQLARLQLRLGLQHQTLEQGMLQNPNASQLLPHNVTDKKIQSRRVHPEASSTEHTQYQYQLLKDGSHLTLSSPQLLPAASTKVPQHSSPQAKIDQQSPLTSISKAGTPLQSAISSFIVPSPKTPLPIPGIPDKQALVISSLAIGTLDSPLPTELSSTDESQASRQPLERLMNVLSSMSPKALNDSVNDIGSIISTIDGRAASAPGNGSRAFVGDDLTARTECRKQASDSIIQDGASARKKMRRDITVMPLNAVSSAGSVDECSKELNGPEMSELESTASSRIKRPRVEANHALLEEIKDINQYLINTVVDICDEDVNPNALLAATQGVQGIIINCSFNIVSLCPDLKRQYAVHPILPLQVLVPTQYPNCSPVLLDRISVDLRTDYEDFSFKTRSRFSRMLRSLSQPLSLWEIVRTWDDCARTVITDYAQNNGGGTFSSRYGKWEKCARAA